MGVNLCIYVHKDDLGKLLGLKNEFPNWDDFLFLVDYTIVRWYTFEQEFHLDRNPNNKDIYELGITSKELLYHMARTDKHIPNREKWVKILGTYNLLFAPDTKTNVGKDWIDVDDLFYAIKKMVLVRFDELMKIYEGVKNEA